MRLTRLLATVATASVAASVLLSAPVPTATAVGAALAAETAEGPSGGRFVGAQGRALDTRPATTVGGYTTPMPANSWRSIQIGGVAGVPATGVSAVHVNLTAIAPAVSGYLRAAADGQTAGAPVTSFLNYSVGKTESNSATIPVAANGRIAVMATGSTNLIIDVQGYYTAGDPTAGGFVPITPQRAVDTRYGTGAPAGKLAASSTSQYYLSGATDVPVGATAAIVNMAIVEPTANGFFQVWASDDAAPSLANTTFNNASAVSSTQIVVPLSTTASTQGAFRFKLSGASAHLVADVVGYFTPGNAGGGFVPASVRALNTQSSGQTPVPAQGTKVVPIQGLGAIPFGGASSVVIHVATVTPSTAGFLNIFAHGITEPGTSSLNFPATQTVANTVVSALGADGNIVVSNHSSNPVNIVIDIEGYFTPVVRTPDDNEIVDDLTVVPAEVVSGMERTATPTGQEILTEAAAGGLDTASAPMSVYISTTSTLVVPTAMTIGAETGLNDLGEPVTEFYVDMGGLGSDGEAGFAVPPRSAWRYYDSGYYEDRVGDIWKRRIQWNVNKANNWKRCATGCDPFDYYRATSKQQGFLQEGSRRGYSRMWYDAIPYDTSQAMANFEIQTPDSPIAGASGSTTVTAGYSTSVTFELGIPPFSVGGATENSYETSTLRASEVLFPITHSKVGAGGAQWCQQEDVNIETARAIVNRVSYVTTAAGRHIKWKVNRGMSTDNNKCPDE